MLEFMRRESRPQGRLGESRQLSFVESLETRTLMAAERSKRSDAELDRSVATYVRILKLNEQQATEFKNLWKTMHDEEASWSSHSQHIVVPDASHYIQFYRPDIVIAAVRSVVDGVRTQR